MPRYDDRPVPPGTSRRWEVVLADDEDDDRPGAACLSGLEIRGEHRVLAGLTEDELGALRLLPEGTALVRFHRYIDLHDPARADFAAEGTERVKPGQRIVAQAETAPKLWEALRRACADAVGPHRRRSA